MAERFLKGVVKFLDPAKGWGFIIPDDDQDSNGRGVYFQWDEGCSLYEEFLGEVSLALDSDRRLSCPEAGDEVIFEETPLSCRLGRHLGRSTYAWSYMGYYRRALRMIEARGSNPYDSLRRVIHFPSGQRGVTVFTGPCSVMEKLADSGANCPWYLKPRKDLQFEELRVEGWMPCGRPDSIIKAEKALVSSAA